MRLSSILLFGALFISLALVSSAAPPSTSLVVFGKVYMANGSNATGANYTINAYVSYTNLTSVNQTTGQLPTGLDVNNNLYDNGLYVQGAGNLLEVIVAYYSSGVVQQNDSWLYNITASDESNSFVMMPTMTLTDVQAPSQVSGFSGVSMGDGEAVNLTWTANTDDTLGYKLYRDGSVIGSFTPASNATYLDTGLTNGQQYDYSITAYDSAPNFATNATTSVTPQDTLAPAQVTGVVVSSSNQTLNMSWSGVSTNSDGSSISDFATYRVYSNMSGAWGLIASTTSLLWSNSSLQNQVAYYFTVAAVDDDGNEGQNSSTTTGTPAARPTISIAPSEGIITSGTTINVTISSSANLDAASYQVYNSSIDIIDNQQNGSIDAASWTYTIDPSAWAEAMAHTVAIWANDTNAQANSQNFTYTVDDTRPAVTGMLMEDGDSLVTSSASVRFNVTVTDVSTIATVTFGASGTEVGLTNSTPTLFSATTDASTLGCSSTDGNCTVTFVATDVAGNINSSETLTFSIDDVSPTVTGAIADDADGYLKSTDAVKINVTVADSNTISTVNVSGGTALPMSLLTGSVYNLTATPAALGCSEGSCILTFTAVDLLGNSNTTTTLSLTVDDTEPSLWDSGVNDTDAKVKSTDSVLFRINVSDTNLSTVSINGTMMTNTAGNLYTTTNTTADWGCAGSGSCTFSITATDLVGNTNTTTATVTVDDIVPTVFNGAIDDTDSLVKSTDTITVTVNATDTGTSITNVSVSGITMTGSGTAYTLSSTTAAALGCTTTGACVLTVTAVDEVLNTNTTTIAFTVDDDMPAVFAQGYNETTIGLSKTIQLYANVTDNIGVFNVSARFESNAPIPLSLSSGALYSVETTATALGISTTGSHTVTITAYDNVSNMNSSETVVLDVDASMPVVLSATANTTYAFSTTSINFSAFVNDTSLTSVLLNGTVMSGTAGGTFSTINTTADWGCQGIEGDCTFLVEASDSVGNLNDSSWITVTIDDLNPRVISISHDATGGYVTGDQVVTISVNVTDANTSTVTINGSALTESAGVYTISSNLTALGCTAGASCVLTVVATDALGNINDSETTSITVDDESPVIVISIPSNGSTTNLSLVNFTVSDGFSIDNSTIAVSGISGYALMSCQGNTTWMNCQFVGTGLSQGSNTITVSTSDQAGNSASNTSTFSYDTAGPVITASYSPVTTPTSPAAGVTLNYSSSDATSSMSQAWYEIDRNGTLIALNISANSAALPTLAAGAHSLVITANDSFNNEANLSVGTFYILQPVNVTEMTGIMEQDATVEDVEIFLENGSVAEGEVYFNQSIVQVITPNSTTAGVNVTINISLLGTNVNTGNADDPVLEVDVTSNIGTTVSNNIGGSSLTAMVMYTNMSLLIEDDAYTDASGIAQWVQIHFERALGIDLAVYIADDEGATAYTLAQCDSNAEPATPATLTGSCYVNGTGFVDVYVPHLSGVIMANPSDAPDVVMNNPTAVVSNSYFNLSGHVGDLNLDSCAYQLYNNSNETIGSQTSLSVTQSETNLANYSFIVTNANDANFEDWTNGTVLNMTVTCTSTDTNSTSTYIAVVIDDTTAPVITARSIAGTASDSETGTMTVTWTTDEYTICGYNASNALQNHTAYNSGLTNLTTAYAKSQVYSVGFSAAGAIAVPSIICIDRNGNSQSSHNATASQSVTITESSGDSSSSGGGSTGGTTPVSASTSTAKVWTELPKGENAMILEETLIPFKKLTFSTKSDLKDVELKVVAFTGKPSALTEVEGVAYKYIEVEEKNIGNDDISWAELSFKVEKTWLVNNGLNADSVSLFRWENGAWTQLKTKRVTWDGVYEYYTADSPGLSYFVISGAVVTVEPEPMPEPEPEPTPPVEEPTEAPVVVTPDTETETEPEAGPEKGGISASGIIALALLVIVFAGIFFLVHKKQEDDDKGPPEEITKDDDEEGEEVAVEGQPAEEKPETIDKERYKPPKN
ncbi:MAG: PGF-pre-PGF domain-containing protein [archaeon]